jgi:hypothetical protein
MADGRWRMADGGWQMALVVVPFLPSAIRHLPSAI